MAPSNGWRGFEQITKVALLAAPFSPEDGTLTATLEKKRNVIEERFAAAIDAMFDDA
jgi:long-subunit acyl-CoA synthetase (AMP-forming)